MKAEKSTTITGQTESRKVVTTNQLAPIHKPGTDRPHEGLTTTQEELAELASDMLLNGGTREDVDLFLKALARHRYRRFLGRHEAAGKSEQEIDQYGSRDMEDVYREISKHWQRRKPRKRARTSAKALNTVVEIVRADIRRQLECQFDQFLGKMEGIESAWLLNEILQYNDSCGYDMAQAFAQVLERDHSYIRIPGHIENEVRNFIDLLEKRGA